MDGFESLDMAGGREGVEKPCAPPLGAPPPPNMAGGVKDCHGDGGLGGGIIGLLKGGRPPPMLLLL